VDINAEFFHTPEDAVVVEVETEMERTQRELRRLEAEKKATQAKQSQAKEISRSIALLGKRRKNSWI
jgi:hypothetical protein